MSVQAVETAHRKELPAAISAAAAANYSCKQKTSVVAHHTYIIKSQEAYCLAAIGIRMIVCRDHAPQLQTDMHPCICKL